MNHIDKDYCPTEQYCTDRTSCSTIKKTRNNLVIATALFVVVLLLYFYPQHNKLVDLHKELGGSVSLFSNPKNLNGLIPLSKGSGPLKDVSDLSKEHWKVISFAHGNCTSGFCVKALSDTRSGISKSKNKDKVIFVMLSLDHDGNQISDDQNEGVMNFSLDNKNARQVGLETGVEFLMRFAEINSIDDHEDTHKSLLLNKNNDLIAYINDHRPESFSKSLDRIIASMN